MTHHSSFLSSHRIVHWLVTWAVQIAIFALAGLGAFLLHFDFSIRGDHWNDLASALIIWIGAKSGVFFALTLDSGLWRYLPATVRFRDTLGCLAGSVIGWVLIAWIRHASLPQSIFVIDLILCILAMSALHMSTRILSDARSDAYYQRPKRLRTLIYGAGDAGLMLLREIIKDPMLAYNVCGFLDDNCYRKRLRVAGIRVLGGGEDIGRLIRRHHIEVILISTRSATGTQVARILELCHAAGVECKMVPGLTEMIEGIGLAGQIRDVAVEDLLGRTTFHLDAGPIRKSIEAKVVLVTGAAGSIGSELCRQLAAFHPAAIVGYEIAESPLFEIDREMCNNYPKVSFYPEVGNIRDRKRFEEVLRRYRPAVVYHAAAYKHVPLMERHVFEAIENNVFGTYNVADASQEFGVEHFVLISSDKAVRPTSVMGTTKRLAELIVLALQNGHTRYVAVRFGNVLGSNGSVVPIFKRQIETGGPVTVTHPEMQRFFMTIPEACQLVLRASVIGKDGQICVLDMGLPVKILDLAKNLMVLSNLRPEQDIRVEFVGTRPGEKLYEELSSSFENTVPSEHEKVRVFNGNGVPKEDLQPWLNSLREICNSRDVGRLIIALKERVFDYSPSDELLKSVLEPRENDAACSNFQSRLDSRKAALF